MTDQQKKTMQKLEEAWPQMNEFHKGFILGIAEASMRDEEKEEQKTGAVLAG